MKLIHTLSINNLMKLSEKRILTNIRLTTHQKMVLAKIINAQTDHIAGEEVSNGRKIVAARNVLMKLGLVNFNNGRASLTNKGMQAARDEGLIDETGNLTDEGKKYAFAGEGKLKEEFNLLRDLNATALLSR